MQTTLILQQQIKICTFTSLFSKHFHMCLSIVIQMQKVTEHVPKNMLHELCMSFFKGKPRKGTLLPWSAASQPAINAEAPLAFPAFLRCVRSIMLFISSVYFLADMLRKHLLIFQNCNGNKCYQLQQYLIFSQYSDIFSVHIY